MRLKSSLEVASAAVDAAAAVVALALRVRSGGGRFRRRDGEIVEVADETLLPNCRRVEGVEGILEIITDICNY